MVVFFASSFLFLVFSPFSIEHEQNKHQSNLAQVCFPSSPPEGSSSALGWGQAQKNKPNSPPLLEPDLTAENGSKLSVCFPLESCTFTVTKQYLPLHNKPTKTLRLWPVGLSFVCQTCTHASAALESRAKNGSLGRLRFLPRHFTAKPTCFLFVRL